METEKKTTHIQVSIDTWKDLNVRKQSPNESFDHVLKRMLLEFPEETEEEKHEYAEDQLSGCLANKERMGVKE